MGPGTLKGYVPSTLFGSLDAGEGLVGTFYDFKRDQDGKATGITAGDYRELLKEFAHGPRGSPPKKRKYYTAGTKLYAKIMMFKGIADTEAGKAFNTPDAGPGLWLAHYTGEVQATQTGSYRLVGWGDNCLVIGFNGKVVLDASDMHYTGAERDDLGAINVPGKPSAFLYAGKSLQLRKGERIRVDMLIGDEGGIFSAGALLQKEGTEMKRGEGGLPDLPALIVAPLGANEMKLFDFIPKENLKGSFFQTRKGFFE